MADSTQVLPKGRSAITLGFADDQVTREFDNSGSDRELGYFLNHADVTDVAQAPVVLAVDDIILNVIGGPPPPLLNPATDTPLSMVMIFADAEVDAKAYAFNYMYGVTDKLTMGVQFPYFTRAYSDVNFDILVVPDAVNYPFHAPIIGMLPKEDMLQAFLKSELGYERLEDFSGGPGIGDVDLFAKYRWVDGDAFKFATSSGVSVPTGRPDDERNLTDIRYGDGSYNLSLAAMVDVKPVDPVLINFTGRHFWALPYHRGVFILDKRVPHFYDMEFPTLHLFGDYDRGDWYELETEAKFEIARGIETFVGYGYIQSGSDKIDGDIIPKSIRIQRKLFFGLSASTVDAYLAKDAKAPMVFRIYAEPIQTGRNVNKTGSVVFTSTLVF
jgi:hypothetical protein